MYAKCGLKIPPRYPVEVYPTRLTKNADLFPSQQLMMTIYSLSQQLLSKPDHMSLTFTRGCNDRASFTRMASPMRVAMLQWGIVGVNRTYKMTFSVRLKCGAHEPYTTRQFTTVRSFFHWRVQRKAARWSMKSGQTEYASIFCTSKQKYAFSEGHPKSIKQLFCVFIKCKV